ncbi:hypothetical protein HZA86_04175 [Candidatus Uhrbacteria bacterium]|nr:hypothetical protein [Candidatus Uhrbacteria bacterium]
MTRKDITSHQEEIFCNENVVVFAQGIAKQLFPDDSKSAALLLHKLTGMIENGTSEEEEWQALLEREGGKLPVKFVPVFGSDSIEVSAIDSPKWIATNKLNGCMATLVYTEDQRGKRSVAISHFPTLMNKRHIAALEQQRIHMFDAGVVKKAIIFLDDRYTEGLELIQQTIQQTLGISDVIIEHYQAGLAKQGDGVVIVSVPPYGQGHVEYRVQRFRKHDG